MTKIKRHHAFKSNYKLPSEKIRDLKKLVQAYLYVFKDLNENQRNTLINLRKSLDFWNNIEREEDMAILYLTEMKPKRIKHWRFLKYRYMKRIDELRVQRGLESCFFEINTDL